MSRYLIVAMRAFLIAYTAALSVVVAGFVVAEVAAFVRGALQ